MCTNYFVLETQMKQIYDLLVLCDLIGEQVLHSVHIVGIPFKFQTLRLCAGPCSEGFMLPEHGAIE